MYAGAGPQGQKDQTGSEFRKMGKGGKMLTHMDARENEEHHPSSCRVVRQEVKGVAYGRSAVHEGSRIMPWSICISFNISSQARGRPLASEECEQALSIGKASARKTRLDRNN